MQWNVCVLAGSVWDLVDCSSDNSDGCESIMLVKWMNQIESGIEERGVTRKI